MPFDANPNPCSRDRADKLELPKIGVVEYELVETYRALRHSLSFHIQAS
jgi:hypothetical protein